MRVALFTILVLAMPAAAHAQANHTSRTITDDAGRQVTCTVGQIGPRQTRGVAIIGRTSSTIDADPTDAIWRSSGCSAEMSMTPQQRIDRTNADLEARFGGPRSGAPDTRFEDAMARMFPDSVSRSDRPSIAGATYVSNSGDSVSGISRRFQVSIADIEGVNGRSFRGALEAGVRITLPENAVDGGSDPYATSRTIISPGTD